MSTQADFIRAMFNTHNTLERYVTDSLRNGVYAGDVLHLQHALNCMRHEDINIDDYIVEDDCDYIVEDDCDEYGEPWNDRVVIPFVEGKP